MQHAPTNVDSGFEGGGPELTSALTKLARDHAREVVTESSKLASAVRMGRQLAHTDAALELLKAAGWLDRGGMAVERFLAKQAPQMAGRMGIDTAQAAGRAATHDPQRIRAMAQQLMDAGHHDIGANWARYAYDLERGTASPHGASMQFMEASLPQIMKRPARPLAHSPSMASVASKPGVMPATSHVPPPGSVAKAPVDPMGSTGVLSASKVDPMGATGSMQASAATPAAQGSVVRSPGAAAMHASSPAAKPAASPVGEVAGGTPAAPARLSDTAVRNMNDEELAGHLAGGNAAPWEKSMPPASATPAAAPAPAPAPAAATTSPVGAVTGGPTSPPVQRRMSARDVALGGLAVGGLGFGGGAAVGRGSSEKPMGMPPLPPGYPQMTVTAAARSELERMLKEAGLFATMGQGVHDLFNFKAVKGLAGAGAKEMGAFPGQAIKNTAQAVPQVAAEAAKKVGKPGMGWGTPLKIMAGGTGIGAAGVGVGAGALGVGHAVTQHQQFGHGAYQPTGPRNFMYPGQM